MSVPTQCPHCSGGWLTASYAANACSGPPRLYRYYDCGKTVTEYDRGRYGLEAAPGEAG